MALNVGTLVAFLTLDNSAYKKGLDQSQQQAGSTATAISNAFAGVTQVLGTVAVASTGLLASLVATGAQFNVLQQTSRASLGVILGGAQAANTQMDKLFQFTKSSPLPKQAFIEAQQTLLGFGITAQNVVPTLQAINDAAVALGGGSDMVARMSSVLAQIQSQGKITGDTLQQLGSMGIDAATIIGDSMGQTAAQIKTSISNGSIDADTALTALVNGLETKFAGASAAVKDQFVGATDRVKAAWRDLGSVVAEPFISAGGGGLFVTWANEAADVLRAVTPLVSELVDEFTTRFAPGLDAVTSGLAGLTQWVRDLDTGALPGMLDKLQTFAPILTGVAAGFLTLGASSLPVVGSLFAGLNPVTVGLVAVAAASPKVRQGFSDLLGAASPLLTGLKNLGAALLLMGQDVLDTAGKMLSGLVPAMKVIVGIVSPIVEGITSLAHGFTQLPTPVKAAAIGLTAIILLRSPLMALSASVISSFRAMSAQVASAGSVTNAVATKMVFAAAEAKAAMLSFLATAWPLLAITAATMAISAWIGKQGDATQAEEAHKQALGDLGDTFDQLTGKVTAATSVKITKDWVDNGTAKQFDAIGQSAGAAAGVIASGDAAGIAAMRAKIIASTDMAAATKVADRAAFVLNKSLADMARGAANGAVSVGQLKAAALGGNAEIGAMAAKVAAAGGSYDDAVDKMTKYRVQVEANTPVLQAYNAQVDDTALAQQGVVSAFTNAAASAETFGNITAGSLAPALLKAKTTGTDVEDVLKALAPAGTDTAQALNALAAYTEVGANKMHYLTPEAAAAAVAVDDVADSTYAAAGGLSAAESALEATTAAALAAAQAMSAGISTALASFVDPVTAWTDSVSQVNTAAADAASRQQKSAEGTAAAAKKADDAAKKAGAEALAAQKKTGDAQVAAATAAQKQIKAAGDARVKAAKLAEDLVKRNRGEDDKAARAAEDNAARRVSAAEDEAKRLKALADGTVDRMSAAAKALQQANFDVAAAAQARQVAEAGLASASTRAERLAWQLAVNAATTDEAAATGRQTAAQAKNTAAQQANRGAVAASTAAAGVAKATVSDHAAAVAHVAAVTADSAAREQAASDATARVTEANSRAQQVSSDALDAVRTASQALYDGLMDRKNAAEDASAANTKTMSDESSGAVDGMAKKLVPSLDSYLATLHQQVQDQTDWKNNMILLAKKIPPDVALALSQLGPSAAPLVAQLVHGTAGQLKTFAADFGLQTTAGVAGMTQAIVAAIPGAATSGALLGTAMSAAIQKDMNSGAMTMAAIAEKYAVVFSQSANGQLKLTVTLNTNPAAQQWANFVQGLTLNSGEHDSTDPRSGNIVARAGGGAIFGRGTTTSDSIAMWGSHNEHMVAADEVAGFGGHAGLVALRRAARNRTLFAGGGEILSAPAAGPGGFSPVPTAASFAAGPGHSRTLNLQITNINPVAVPDSVATNRALALAALVDGG